MCVVGAEQRPTAVVERFCKQPSVAESAGRRDGVVSELLTTLARTAAVQPKGQPAATTHRLWRVGVSDGSEIVFEHFYGSRIIDVACERHRASVRERGPHGNRRRATSER